MVVLNAKELVDVLEHQYGFQVIGDGLSRVVLVSPDAPDCVIKINLFDKHLTQNENEIKVYKGARKTNVPIAKIISHSEDNKIIKIVSLYKTGNCLTLALACNFRFNLTLLSLWQ